MALNYINRSLVLVSAITVSVSVSALALLACVFVGVASFSVVLKIFTITAGIKKYKSVIKKNRKSLIKLSC